MWLVPGPSAWAGRLAWRRRERAAGRPVGAAARLLTRLLRRWRRPRVRPVSDGWLQRHEAEAGKRDRE